MACFSQDYKSEGKFKMVFAQDFDEETQGEADVFLTQEIANGQSEA